MMKTFHAPKIGAALAGMTKPFWYICRHLRGLTQAERKIKLKHMHLNSLDVFKRWIRETRRGYWIVGRCRVLHVLD